MTTGTTYDFEQSRDEIISDALSNLGAVPPDGTPRANQRDHAIRALNRVVKRLDEQGIQLWRVVRRTTTTTDGTPTFSPAADVIGIDDPMSYIKAGQTGRSILKPMSRKDYMAVGDRTIEATPTLYMVERTLTGLTVTFYPVPDTTGDTIEYQAVLKSKDFDTGADTPDFTQPWTVALVYGLSQELAPTYRQPQLAEWYKALFEAEVARLQQETGEKGPVYIIPQSY